MQGDVLQSFHIPDKARSGSFTAHSWYFASAGHTIAFFAHAALGHHFFSCLLFCFL